MTTPTTATAITKPLRGSVDSEGVIMGGAALTIDYELEASPYGLLQYESQRRSPKSLRTLEAKFQDQIRESDVKKFDGKLEVTNSGKEHNLENFCKEVKKGIQYFGFQPFFYGPSQADANKMINYAEDHHLVDLPTVLTEHTARLVKPAVVNDANGNETAESVIARHKCYDDYELRDMALTRLYICSLLTDTFYETVNARHLTMGHDFERIPGQVLFMMVLDACHASIKRDFDGARKALADMTLAQFPGEDVTAFATFAQKRILVLMSDFALPIDLGSTLLFKVMDTESKVFNTLVMNHYMKVKSMEKKYDAKNPQLLTADADYQQYGPIASMEFLQNEHGTMLSDHNWPATARQLPPNPSGNATGDVDLVSSSGTKHGGGSRPIPAHIKCHCCGENHYKRDCQCEKCKGKRTQGGGSRGGGRGGRGRGRGGVSTGQPKNRSWRFVEPANKTKAYKDADGKSWWWCNLCNKGDGAYCLSHDTDGSLSGTKHDPNYKPVAPAGHMAEGDVLAHQPSSIPAPTVLTPPDVQAAGPTEVSLQFTGDPSPGAWACAVDMDPEDDDLRILNVVSTPWTLRPRSDMVEQQEETPMAASIELPTPELMEDPQDAVLYYFDCVLIKDLVFFDASDDAWLLNREDDDLMDMFYDAHDDTQGEFVKDNVFYDARPDPFNYGAWTARKPTFLERIKQTIATKWQKAMMHSTIHLLALSCTLWEALEDLGTLTNSRTESRRDRRRKRPTLLTFPARWLIFSALMLLPGGLIPARPHPFNKSCSVWWLARSAAYPAIYSQYCEQARDLGTTPRDIWAFHVLQCRSIVHLLKPLVTTWAPPIADTGVEKERSDCYDDNNKEVDLVRTNGVEYFKTAVEEPDPQDESLETALGVPQDQVSEAVWLDMVDVSSYYPAPTFEDGHTFYECLKTCKEKDDMWKVEDPWLMQNVLWPAFRETHVIRSADAQGVYFGEPEANISENGYYDLLMSPTALLAEALPMEGAFPVIFDTGATLAVTGQREDFIGNDFHTPMTDLRLGGLARGLKIAGIGTVHWSFIADDGSVLTIQTKAYYVPEVQQRLISPQSLFKASKGIHGCYRVGEMESVLEFVGKPTLTVRYQTGNRLPIGYGTNSTYENTQEMEQSELNLCVTCEDNQNLTPAKKLLLQWHYRLGHKNIGALQTLIRHLPDVFPGPKYQAAARSELPLPRCAVCEYAKGHRKPTQGKTSTPTPEREGALKVNDLRPGSSVSVDHFESRQEGRTYESYGKSKSQYQGGCIFVDHASGYIHVEHQLGFSSSETLRAKHNFEQRALEHGVVVTNYLADNGTFKARQFVDEIRNRNQLIRYCGVNAHHKNGIAERAIRTVTEMSRAMILHASAHWKDQVEPTLWPMAIDYAVHLYNHLPNDKGIAPADIFTGTQTPRHKLRDMHVWGCPTYVLDPVLQQGKKLPRWQPRSRQGMFLGLSPKHSSDVPFILNLQTGSISPQYHVVFDDMFSTVNSIGKTDDVPAFWEDLLLDSRLQIPLDEGSSEHAFLDDDWLTSDERDAKRRHTSRVDAVRMSYRPTTPIASPWPNVVHPGHLSDNVRENTSDSVRENTSSPSSDTTNVISNRTETAATQAAPITDTITVSPHTTFVSRSGSVLAPTPTTLNVPQQATRTSMRTNKGTWKTNKFANESWLAAVYVEPCEERLFQQEEALAYMAALSTDLETGLLEITNPMIYAALKKRKDPDTPDYAVAMSGEDKQQYLAAMEKEINELKDKDTWKVVPRAEAKGMNILPSTWAFKKKRYPDGRARKHKARFCCRGDRQLEGVDYFETYAPTVGWSTIRLLLTLTLANEWETRQVDYTNAFAQADIKEEVFVELPRDFAATESGEFILKLNKSLYGLKQAPRTFFEHLQTGLIERGFKQSAVDPCLFMKDKMICVVYVDDTIFAGPDGDELEKMIHSLTEDHGGTKTKYELESEGSVQDFLGINITQLSEKSFRLTQTGLIQKILEKTMMIDARTKSTPASTTALGTDKDGEPFNETWEYASVVGMLMYLGTNSRPDIAFSVNQCARHTHNPRESHAKAVKHICRYLKGTATRGLEFTLNGEMAVDCYVDSDFAGLWNQEDDQDPVSTRSRTGYFLTFGGCPLLWGSKLQTETALSTMEAEYIALSQSMRELIPIREIILEMQKIVFGGRTVLVCRSHSKIYEKNGTKKDDEQNKLPISTVYEDNNACLKFATAPKMSPRTKHIAVKYHFFREKVVKLEIQVIRIDSAENAADAFTKGLPEATFQKLRKKLMGW